MKVNRFMQKIKTNNFFNFAFTTKYNAHSISMNFMLHLCWLKVFVNKAEISYAHRDRDNVSVPV